MKKILVADDEEGIRSFIAEVLEDEGYTVTQAPDGETAWKLAQKSSYDLLITDMKMPGLTGVELLQKVKEEQPETEVIILTAHGTVSSAVEAMKTGAFDYLSKPLDSPDELIILFELPLELSRLKRQVESFSKTTGPAHAFVANSPKSQQLKQQLKKVAATTASVLLIGESGTGKEVAARYIHKHSNRSDAPFIAMNCGAIPENLLESELFGYEKGAFTGATERRKGKFELADGATLFLDEIGEMAMAMQVKLLRILQEQCFERVGGTRTITTDVRIIAATNKNLKESISEGTFREDLYHRLAVFPVQLVPLRERQEDIEPITSHLLGKLAARYNHSSLSVSPKALTVLKGYTWPGNVRELSNVLERAAILCGGSTIDEEHILIDPSQSSPSPGTNQTAASSAGEAVTLKDIEKQAIIDALNATGGHRKKAAEKLGIALRTLYDKIKLYKIT